MKHIHFCQSCNKYTMKHACSLCSTKTHLAKPAKFSPLDKYGKYRREVKQEELKKKGLL